MDDIQRLKRSIDLRDLIARFEGAPMKKSGRVHFYAIRDERTPSFAVYPDGYYDFGNPSDSGDHLDYLQNHQDMTFPEALAYLSGETNISLPAPKQPRMMQREKNSIPSGIQFICERFTDNLLAHRSIMDWLKNKTGANEKIIRRYGLGYNPSWHRSYKIPPGLIIPWWHNGEIVAIKIRCAYENDSFSKASKLRPQNMKYMAMPGSRFTPYIYGYMGPAQNTIICEGELDTIALSHAIGSSMANVITTGNASGKLPDYMIDHCKKSNLIIIAQDNDQAGQEASIRLQRQLNHAGCATRIIKYPTHHKDACDVASAGEDLLEWYISQFPIVRITLEDFLAAPPGRYIPHSINWD